MLSKTSIHALRAMIVLAELPPGDYAGAGRLAERIEAPPNYLGKLLQQLARSGLVRSQKGISGGFRLARAPAAITVFEIVEPLEHIDRWDGCILGRRECGGHNPCPLHETYGRIRQEYLTFLRSTTLATLMNNQALVE
jgi:Rrf2 family transcriptional regulator, iron-sulfur cluster assembly transcription factor